MLKYFKRLFCCKQFFICSPDLTQILKSLLVLSDNPRINSFSFISYVETEAFYFDITYANMSCDHKGLLKIFNSFKEGALNNFLKRIQIENYYN